jgi:two-component system cell cycle response regulator PopA
MTRALNVALVDDDRDLSLKPADLEVFRIKAQNVASDRPLGREAVDAVIIAASDGGRAQELAILHAGSGRGRPPVILISETETPPDGFDGWLRRPVSPVQLANRVQSLRRLWVMEDIARRRKAAAEVFGHTTDDDTLGPKQATVLFVGAATSRFMAVRHALAKNDTTMIAAFSSFSAFDYLHERPFDAVILNAIEKKDMAFTISSAMRRNARLYHTPVLLLTASAQFEAADEAFARGVSDILPAESSPGEISARVLRLAEERRRRRAAKAVLENCRARATIDTEFGLYKPKFALAHLQDLLTAANRNRKPASLVLMAMNPPESGVSWERFNAAQQQFASMLRHLLRAEDFPAHLRPNLFAAILPYTNREGALCVAERISAVAECTAFDSDDPLHPFRLNVNCVALEAAGEETAEALIERGMKLLNVNRMEAI